MLIPHTSHLIPRSIKDYYKILSLPHTANDREIKKAFRHMAMRFHPDKNEGNELAENHFREVQEAYEVLSDPRRRSAYNQQRWYLHTGYKQPDDTPITSHSILYKCRALNRYLSALDTFHVNQQALNQYIIQLLSEATLQLLLVYNDTLTNNLIITELLKSIRPLSSRYVENIASFLERLAGSDSQTIESIRTYVKEKKLSGYWDKYLPLMILFITIFLCVLIYLVSRS